ncbi:peptidoglycan-binding protein [uncultured Clostridium sp.]|uniref:peptidoglycan-binding domain-containing protein n=1 Tax=uncultured Clostridium sp. TaxID=59620 RepID=UPI00260F7087|nr:peptidoglycan-binding protein [uncultured Clostridium sp.]
MLNTSDDDTSSYLKRSIDNKLKDTLKRDFKWNKYEYAIPFNELENSEDILACFSGVKGRTGGETYLIDMHGWEGSMVGDSKIGRHFTGKLGLVQKGFGNPRGFLVQWSNSIGIISSIMELPSSIYSHADVVRLNCAGKIIEGLTEIMGTTGGGSTSGDYNGHIKSGIQYVNIRTVPTTANNTPISKLYGDNPIKIIGKTKASDGYYWYKFEYNGGYAYVREDFVITNANIPVITEGGGNDNGDLKIGSRGDRVKDLQSKLAYVGLPVSIDGVFGEETEKNVKEFQKIHELYVDGIVGKQ